MLDESKDLVNANITSNGSQQITGKILKNVLLGMLQDVEDALTPDTDAEVNEVWNSIINS